MLLGLTRDYEVAIIRLAPAMAASPGNLYLTQVIQLMPLSAR